MASLQHEFLIPQAAVRLWGLSDAFHGQPYTADVGDDVRHLASSLLLPYCGLNTGFAPAAWLDDADTVTSVALVPLRTAADGPAFGLLVLGSPDPTRYSADMGTEFLVRIGEVASAALSRLGA